MKHRTTFTPTKKHILEIEEWLKIEEKNTNSGFFCNWDIIKEAYYSNEIGVILLGNTPIGFITFKEYKNTANISIAEIKPEYRKKGYAGLMLDGFFNYLISKNIFIVELFCEPKSTEIIWRKLGFIRFPEFPFDNERVRMYKTLIETLKPEEVIDANETIELWNERPHLADRIDPSWIWSITSSKLKNPIIFPAFYDWQICWKKDGVVKEISKVKRFTINENKDGRFIVINELK